MCSPADVMKDYYSDYAKVNEVEELNASISILEKTGLVTLVKNSSGIKKIIVVKEQIHIIIKC